MEGIVWGSEARSLPGGLFIPWSGVFTKILSRTPLHCRFKCATLAQSIYFLFSRPVRPSGDSYSFQKIYAFPLLKFEKQEISSSPAKGGQMNSMNDLVQAPARLPKPRRDYKDTLFRLLFQDRDRLLSLYNAVNGTSYDSPEDLTVVTLENAVYMNMKNDVAFLVDFQLNLYEHQSTWNPNMPLRNLFYAAKEYQVLTRDQSLYAPQLVKIPTPHFVVFYNGDKEIGDPGLELKVKVLKIAPEKNKELLDTYQVLKEYMLFGERVRLHAKTMAVQEAVHRAVTECIREGILSDFLSRNRAEVIAVSIFEYDEERELALMRKAIASEARKEGIAEGHAEGHAAGRTEGRREGILEGREDEIKSLIRTKLQKGKSISQIADELERDEETIERVIRGMEEKTDTVY